MNNAKAAAKQVVLLALKDRLDEVGAVRYGNEFEYAVPVGGEDGEIMYVTVELTAKNNMTYVDKAGRKVEKFDPDFERELYEDAQRIKAECAANRAAEREAASAKAAEAKKAARAAKRTAEREAANGVGGVFGGRFIADAISAAESANTSATV